MSLFKKLFPVDDLRRTVRRFPGSAVCSFTLFILVLLSIHEIIDLDENVFSRILVILVYGFFWFGLARLLVEGKSWSLNRERLLGYGGFAVLAAFVFIGSGFSLVWLLVLMIPALLLGISVGPYVESDDNLSFWFYNRQIWQGAGVAIAAGLLWGAGISAALGSIRYLFEVKIGPEIYRDIWVFAMTVFAPLYALSWVPEKYKYSEEDCHAPPQLSFMINWVFAPLVVVYMLILYAYFIKIALVGELPRGQLSYMITAFGGVGVLTYLAGWPLRETGGPLLKPIYKVFFPALFIPVGMQAISIYLRLDQYGVTEQRYLVALSTVWFALLAVGYTFKKPSLKFITGSLALMLLVAALGPLSAPNVSERSQMGRLEALLVANDILVDEKIVKTEKTISFEDRKSISSILDFLRERKKLDRLKLWLPGSPEGSFVPYPREMTKKMGFEFVGSYQRKQGRASENVRLNAPNKMKVTNVSGYKLFLNSQYVSLHWSRQDREPPTRRWALKSDDHEKVVAYYENDKLYVGLYGRDLVAFDVVRFAFEEFERDPSDVRRHMVLEKAQGDLRVRLIFNHINLRRDIVQGEEDAPYKLNDFSFKALIDY